MEGAVSAFPSQGRYSLHTTRTWEFIGIEEGLVGSERERMPSQAHYGEDVIVGMLTLASDYLEQAEYSIGTPEEDLKTQSLVRQLVYNPKLLALFRLNFEAKLWQEESGPELMQQIQNAVMDCVGCEKCRLWGKLQVLGLGTALKILFSVNGQGLTNKPLQLQRKEVIALVNLLNRLSESIHFVRKMAPHIDKIMAGGGEGSSPSSKTVFL